MAESIMLTEDRTTDTEQLDDQAAVQAEAATVAPAPLLTEELLVEEVSIDGMCGVY
jgi:mycofactocin precursor